MSRSNLLQTAFGLVLILLAAVFAAGCSSAAQQAATHLTRGEKYLENQQFAEAALEFRSAAEIDKQSASAHFGLARTFEEQERFAEAVEELRKTVALDRNHLEALIKLGNYLLLSQPPQTTETERLIADVFRVNPNHADGYVLRATLLAVQKRSASEVLAILDQAIAAEPNKVESYLSKARFLAAQQNFGEAEKTFQKALEINSNSVAAKLDYGRFLDFASRAAEAEKQFRLALEIAPNDRRALETLAKFLVARGELDRAEEIYRKLAALNQNAPETKIVLADFYQAIGKDQPAIEIYREILTKQPESVRARAKFAELFLQRGDQAGANEQANQILSRNARDAQGLLLRARVRLRGGDAAAAIKDLQEVLKQEPNNKLTLYFMADAQFRMGKPEQARTFINDLKRFHPDYLYADQLLINLDSADSQFERARRRADELLGKLQKAERGEVSERDLRELKVGALTARGLANLQLNKIADAQNDLSLAQTVEPGSPQVYLNLAKIQVRAGDLPAAQNLYAKALEIDANGFEAISGMINARILQKQFAEAHELLDKRLIENQNGSRQAALLYLKSNVFAAQNNFADAENVLQTAITTDADYLPAYLAYAALLSGNGQIDRAIAQYRRALERSPNDANIHTLIGLLEDNRENYDAAVENYRQALVLNPNQVIAANNLGWLYANHGKGNLDEAVMIVQKLVEKYPNEAAYADTLGWIFYKKGVAELGIAQMRRAVALDEQKNQAAGRGSNPGYQIRLAAAYAATGDKQNARRHAETGLQNRRALTKSEFEQVSGLLAQLN